MIKFIVKFMCRTVLSALLYGFIWICECALITRKKQQITAGIEWSQLAAAALFTLFPCHAHLSGAEIYGGQRLICAGGRPPNRCNGMTGGRTSLHAPKGSLCICAPGKFGIWPSLLHSGPAQIYGCKCQTLNDESKPARWLDVSALCERTLVPMTLQKLDKVIPLWKNSKNYIILSWSFTSIFSLQFLKTKIEALSSWFKFRIILSS